MTFANKVKLLQGYTTILLETTAITEAEHNRIQNVLRNEPERFLK